jgi:hypothetical protein
MKLKGGIEVKIGDVVLARIRPGGYSWVVWQLTGDEPLEERPDDFRPIILSKKLVRRSFRVSRSSLPVLSGSTSYSISVDGRFIIDLPGKFGLKSEKTGGWRLRKLSSNFTYVESSTRPDIHYLHQLQGQDIVIDITRLKKVLYGSRSKVEKSIVS